MIRFTCISRGVERSLRFLGLNSIPCRGFILHVNFTKCIVKLTLGHILRTYFHLKFQIVIIFSIIIITE
jgi:hypothetical protein